MGPQSLTRTRTLTLTLSLILILTLSLSLALTQMPKEAVGVRLEGQGRTLHYLPSQLLLLPPPPIAGVSLACLRSFREAHRELLSG